MDVQISGDQRGIVACEKAKASQKEDVADVLDAAGSFGRAFLREKVGQKYRIWEISPATGDPDEQASGPESATATFEVSLFAEGQIPLTPDEDT